MKAGNQDPQPLGKPLEAYVKHLDEMVAQLEDKVKSEEKVFQDLIT